MIGPSLAPNSDLKKNYKFIWRLDLPGTDVVSPFAQLLNKYVGQAMAAAGAVVSAAKSIKGLFSGKTQFTEGLSQKLAKEAISQKLLTSYVSQFTKKVTLPPDELDIEYYKVGPINYPVPKSRKINNISVTFLDDTYDTVYNFHRAWQDLAIPKIGLSNVATFSIKPFTFEGEKYGTCLQGTYISYENELSLLTYPMYSAGTQLLGMMNNAMGSVIPAEVSMVAGGLFSLTGMDPMDSDLFLKYTSSQTFPCLFPIKISRSDAEKSGDNLAEVTVEYQRIPDIKSMFPLNGPCHSSNKYGF